MNREIKLFLLLGENKLQDSLTHNEGPFLVASFNA
jgi:hypothetical protein